MSACEEIQTEGYSCVAKYVGNYPQLTYRQRFGAPMGSPLSPVLALLTMDHILQQVTGIMPF